MISAIGLRYASALADVVLEKGSEVSPEQALDQVRSFAEALRISPELHNALLSPAVQNSRKRAVIARLGEPLGLSRIVRNFLFVIIDHRRVDVLGAIAESLEEIFDEHFGVARADISAARALDSTEASALEQQLGRVTGKKIRARYSIDESLLGSAVARIGSTVYDGSVRGYFENLRRELAGQEI